MTSAKKHSCVPAPTSAPDARANPSEGNQADANAWGVNKRMAKPPASKPPMNVARSDHASDPRADATRSTGPGGMRVHQHRP